MGKNLEAKVSERTREIKQMQTQLIRSEKLVSLGRLVAGITHEINNPLQGILMFANLTSKSPKLDPALKSDMDVIINETNRCANIVKGLLDFSRESIPQKNPPPLTISLTPRSLSSVANRVFTISISSGTISRICRSFRLMKTNCNRFLSICYSTPASPCSPVEASRLKHIRTMKNMFA